MNIPKAVVMDMDGTLLDENNEIRPFTQSVLMALQKQGTRLILASGRSYSRLMKYARQLEMEKYGGLLIEIDGVAYYDLQNDHRIKFEEMSPETISDVFTWLMHHNAESQAVFDDGLFAYIPQDLMEMKKQLRQQMNVAPDFPWTAGPWNWLSDLRDGYPHQSYIHSMEEITRPINKIQIMQEESELESLYRDLYGQFSDRFAIYRTTPRQLEILPFGRSKGACLKTIMEENGWKPEDVIVFGDGENDVSLFEQTPNSYAMGNAKPFVQHQASAVCPSNREEGIAKTLFPLTQESSANFDISK